MEALKRSEYSVPPALEEAIEKLKAIDFRASALKPEFDKGLQFHPDGYLDTEHKRDMFYAFQWGAADGLSDYLYDYARKNKANEDAFKYFRDDEKEAKPVLPLLITTMHPEVVKAVICGNLTYRYSTEASFKSIVDRTTGPTTTPGIYFNQLYDCGTDMEAETQKSSPMLPEPSNKGRGFSYENWQTIHDAMALYRVIGLCKTSRLHICRSKKCRHHRSQQKPNARRFLADKESRKKKLEEYLSVIRTRVLRHGQQLSDSEKQTQASWSTFEIGHSFNTLNHLKGYIGSESTNFMWDLLNAIVTVKFKGKFATKQGQLLYLCKDTHRDLGEALCSVLASSYHDEMGCNPSRAGGIGGEPPAAQRGYRTNIAMLLVPSGIRHRGYARGKEHNQMILKKLQDLDEQERKKPIAQALAEAEETRKAVLERVEKVRNKHEAVEYLKAEDKLMKMVKDYAESRACDEASASYVTGDVADGDDNDDDDDDDEWQHSSDWDHPEGSTA